MTEKNTTFDERSFHAARLLRTTRFWYFRKYSWSYPQRGWRNLGFVIRSTHKEPLTDNSKDVTDQGHLTEKLVNKLQNRYGIALEQNLDYTVLQLKFALTVGAAYFTIALRLIVKTSPAYVSLILHVITVRICNNLECIRLSNEAASQRKTQNASKLISITI